MKNLRSIFSILAMSLIMFSCNEDNDKAEVVNEIKRTETITLPAKGGENARGEISGTIEFTFDENSEVVTNIAMSPNLSAYLDLTDDQLEQMVEAQVLGEGDNKDKHDHATCISGCNAAYTNADGTKKPGRGACKFNCWVSTTVQLVKALAPAIVAAM